MSGGRTPGNVVVYLVHDSIEYACVLVSTATVNSTHHCYMHILFVVHCSQTRYRLTSRPGDIVVGQGGGREAPRVNLAACCLLRLRLLPYLTHALVPSTSHHIESGPAVFASAVSVRSTPPPPLPSPDTGRIRGHHARFHVLARTHHHPSPTCRCR